MAKFKVIFERVETITKQGAVMVEASTAEEARRIILVESDIGDITVAVELVKGAPYLSRSFHFGSVGR